jgi:anti-sigma factor RsiW
VNIFTSHVSFERLVDLVEGRLPANEQSQLLVHLSDCARCAADKAWLERVIGLMRADTAEDAPPPSLPALALVSGASSPNRAAAHNGPGAF